jgi:hypothetical protein
MRLRRMTSLVINPAGQFALVATAGKDNREALDAYDPESPKTLQSESCCCKTLLLQNNE